MPDWLPFLAALLTNGVIFGLLALSLNVQFGFAGLMNFGVVAFFAAGAFASALATLPPPGSPEYAGSYEIGLGLPFGAGLAIAAAAGGLLGLVVGATSLRLGGHYLAIVTFALAQVFAIFLANEEWLTNGEFGISTVPQPLRGLAKTGDAYLVVFLALGLLILIACYVLIQRVTRSPFGRVLRGLREDEQAARGLGKRTARLKLKAFVLGGLLAGVAGSLWVHSIGAVHVGQFEAFVTFNVWLAVLLGGVGNNLGVLIGALLLVSIREGTRFLDTVPLLDEAARSNPSLLPNLRFVIIGLLLILIVRFAPDGVLPERLHLRRSARLANRRRGLLTRLRARRSG